MNKKQTNQLKEKRGFIKMKILLVEDDKFIRDSFVERLRSDKYEVSSAKDGEEAIEKITANDFDIVITNIEMPKVNGIEVLKFIKKNKPKTKVVMISAYVSQKVINKVMELGADEYIEKSSFLKNIARILNKIG
jgi:CheY-like chemotaxis protein